jgi:rSAM/selenodomain-associated transferase 1
MAKAPMAGRSKTRLCPPCTAEQAATVAEAALRDTISAVCGFPTDRRVIALEGPAGPWLPEGFDVVEQRGDGLDERLAAVFSELSGPVLLVGMDTPQASAGHLSDAAALLARPDVDAVLGHAVDGGWWAIGMTRPDPAVFDGVPMSTGETGARQEARVRELGYRVALLPELRDVDEWDDALLVADEARGGCFAQTVRSIQEHLR